MPADSNVARPSRTLLFSVLAAATVAAPFVYYLAVVFIWSHFCWQIIWACAWIYHVVTP